MSYCYDVMARKWEELRALLPAAIRDGETAVRFGFLIDAMHEANHDLRDAINHNDRVRAAARRLDNIPSELEPKEQTNGTCSRN